MSSPRYLVILSTENDAAKGRTLPNSAWRNLDQARGLPVHTGNHDETFSVGRVVKAWRTPEDIRAEIEITDRYWAKEIDMGAIWAVSPGVDLWSRGSHPDIVTEIYLSEITITCSPRNREAKILGEA